MISIFIDLMLFW